MSIPFQPIEVGKTKLKNRIVMSPMTRSRAYGEGFSPTPLMADYYSQRAGAGLVITEGIHPSPIGQGYPTRPGHTARSSCGDGAGSRMRSTPGEG